MILSIELITRFNYISSVNSVRKLTQKALKIISNKNISDHWKEKVIPQYSLNIMKLSIFMLLIILSVIFLFFITDFISSGFLYFVISIKGIITSTFFAFIYLYFKKIMKK